MYLYLYLPSKNHLYLYLYLTMEKLLYLYLQSFFCICPNPDVHRLQGCHIPIHKHVQKILEVSCLGQDFKALPFGLSTAPLEFTVVTKEVKLMAVQKGIRIHQYLDDWLVWAKSHQICLQHTQILVTLCQKLGCLVNMERSELEPKQIFDIVGYQFDQKQGRVRPT